ncbi:MAG TPA: hypothetical protein VHE34_00890 [Puia sp.]|uniref:pPIWI-associating nuclease domain-containing protein n=1 Tax=Puia sp. TaxID=2045100 RepID=UPI002C490851|nr:hypothetical protein [Puia sp.]HVU93740.1 hypothetical protein [Puia sp.]
MSIDDLSKQVSSLLEGDFLKRLFAASIDNLKDRSNPLRINNFSFSLRSVIDNILKASSPSEEIQLCSWFDPEIHTFKQSDKTVPNRESQLKYAIQFGVDDDFVMNDLNVDVSKHIKELKKAYERLNAYTHITEKTFGTDEIKANSIIQNILQSLHDFLSLIQSFKAELFKALEEKVYNAVDFQAMYETLLPLDEIASHHSIEEIYLDNYKIKSIDSVFIRVESKGKISVVHQFGSNSDLKNDDGAEVDQEYPFDCNIAFYCSDPTDWDAEESNFSVDTSKWWDGYYDETEL